ncbi:hypothetical protein ABOM_007869 [Aspergillus bombycis]|uniref:Zn(2)-C6 fungal-type domain-containing protein n=1 Tax=Aspergillus bombycis TaxID=109264 RepID=A0A1F7ZSG1_9EURO|nr:hypothetical protein ABOM_007869 [Aspergillus bombycis]OGM42357.1 hypothetical protein ABOM_007869 [Aspergillus bombycis]
MPITDEDERTHRQKRRRVSKACDRCRHGKLKCNGALPQCDTCIKADKPCSYGTAIRRRGLRTGYVRALECLMGLVFQSVEGSETTVEKLIANTWRKRFWTQEDIQDDLNGGETPWERWKSSKIPQAIDALLSAHDNMDDDDLTTPPLNLSTQGKDTNLTWSTLDLPPPTPQSQFNATVRVACLRCSKEAGNETRGIGSPATHQNQEVEERSIVTDQPSQDVLPELPRNPMQLLSRYFSLVHSWLPIVERHAVYRSLFAYYKTSSILSIRKRRTGETALLWAILTYASMIQDHSTNQVTLFPKYTSYPNQLYMAARKAIPLEKEDDYSVGHVQALLILGLVHYSCCEWNIARVVVGQAILLASRIGLNQPDKCQPEYHRRTWLGCFALDTLISAHTETSPWIRSRDVQEFLAIDKTGNEEWEPWHLQDVLLPGVGTDMAEFAAPTHTLTVFVRLLELLCIKNDWIFATTKEQNKACKKALRSWRESLPEHIKSHGADVFSTASASLPPNILNLYIIQAFLRTRLCYPTSAGLPMGWNHGQEWQILIHAMEGFFGRFDNQAIPASFNLLKIILPRQIVEASLICDLVVDLKKTYSGELTCQPRPDIYGQKITINGKAQSKSGPAIDNSTDIILQHPSLRTEQQFSSLMEISGPWPSINADPLPEQRDINDESSPEAAQSTVITSDSCDLPSVGEFPDDAGLAYPNDWDDIEMQVSPLSCLGCGC